MKETPPAEPIASYKDLVKLKVIVSLGEKGAREYAALFEQIERML